MSTNWKNLVEKDNAEVYVLPKGWDSKETVAGQLECSEDKVDDHLRPALKSGKVTKKQFRVWNEQIKRVILVTAYAEEKLTPAVAVPVPKLQELKASGKSYAEIGAEVGMTGDAVRAKLRKVS